MAEAMSAEPASPPQAKKRGAPEDEKLSLEAIREVVRSEVGGSTAALRAEISQRMDRVETGVTAQLEKTLERLAAINNQQQEQQRTVEATQGEQYSMNARLQALESKVHVLQTTGTSSTADTDFGGRKPALIMGGWGDDTPAEETLNNVKQMVKDLRLDIPTDQAFVPGVRRGYAILPYGAKEGEDQQQLRERLSAALKRVRQANIQMGTHADGKAKYLWLQLSQSPERRRRVQLAGKCKRLCLNLGATLSQWRRSGQRGRSGSGESESAPPRPPSRGKRRRPELAGSMSRPSRGGSTSPSTRWRRNGGRRRGQGAARTPRPSDTPGTGEKKSPAPSKRHVTRWRTDAKPNRADRSSPGPGLQGSRGGGEGGGDQSSHASGRSSGAHTRSNAASAQHRAARG